MRKWDRRFSGWDELCETSPRADESGTTGTPAACTVELELPAGETARPPNMAATIMKDCSSDLFFLSLLSVDT